MTQQTAAVIIEPQHAVLPFPGPGAGGLLRPSQRTVKNMRYPGLMSTNSRRGHRSRKYETNEHSERYARVRIRKLSPAEIAEWYGRLEEIMNGATQLRREPL